MNKKFIVSIVLYNTDLSQLKKCLDSLKKVDPNPVVILVDNSKISNINHIKNLYDHIVYIHLPKNPGFGSGHNVALKISQTKLYDYHLVINADVYFDEDVITPMIKYMEQDLSVALMMPKVLNPDGSIQRLCKLLPSPNDLFLRRFVRLRIFEERSKIFEMHESGYNKVTFSPYLSGCFMLLRNDALVEVGLFDENFFMYPEDIDLTRRLALKFNTLFFPLVSVYHVHGRSSYKSFKMLFVHIYNIVLYFNKWGWFFDPLRKQLNNKAKNQFLNDF